ncbi:MAG: hypothetical protein ACXU82_20305 [Caulobacteraceae bacterium]
MVEVSTTSVPDDSGANEPWIVSQDPSGLWSAMINLGGDWVPLGYFGAREDAEETIAACLQPSRPLEGRAD